MSSSLLVEKIARFSGHSGSIYGLFVSALNQRIYTGARDGYVVEWDTEKPEEGVLLCKLDEPIYSLYLFEPKHELWIGTASGRIHVVNLGTKEEIKILEIHQNGVFDIKLFQNQIAAAGGDGAISLIDPESFQLIQLKKFSNKSCRVLAIHPKGEILAAGFSDFSFKLFRKNLDMYDQKQTAHSNSVFSLCFSPDGQYLLSGGRDAMLKVWKHTLGLELEKEIPAHLLHIHCISVQSEGKYLLTSSMDKTIKIWDLQDFSLLKVIDYARYESHTSSINKLAWINSTEFVSIGDDKSVILWKLKT